MTAKTESPVPTASRVPTREEWDARIKAYREAVKGKRIWPAGSVSKCVSCGKKSLVGRDDLSTNVPRTGGVVVFRNLRGAKCTSCGTQVLEPFESIGVDEQIGIGRVADFEAKVSRIGSGTLGTYWPKDVVRNLHLTPEKKAYIQVLDESTAVVRFE